MEEISSQAHRHVAKGRSGGESPPRKGNGGGIDGSAKGKQTAPIRSRPDAEGKRPGGAGHPTDDSHRKDRQGGSSSRSKARLHEREGPSERDVSSPSPPTSVGVTTTPALRRDMEDAPPRRSASRYDARPGVQTKPDGQGRPSGRAHARSEHGNATEDNDDHEAKTLGDGDGVATHRRDGADEAGARRRDRRGSHDPHSSHHGEGADTQPVYHRDADTSQGVSTHLAHTGPRAQAFRSREPRTRSVDRRDGMRKHPGTGDDRMTSGSRSAGEARRKRVAGVEGEGEEGGSGDDERNQREGETESGPLGESLGGGTNDERGWQGRAPGGGGRGVALRGYRSVTGARGKGEGGKGNEEEHEEEEEEEEEEGNGVEDERWEGEGEGEEEGEGEGPGYGATPSERGAVDYGAIDENAILEWCTTLVRKRRESEAVAKEKRALQKRRAPVAERLMDYMERQRSDDIKLDVVSEEGKPLYLRVKRGRTSATMDEDTVAWGIEEMTPETLLEARESFLKKHKRPPTLIEAIAEGIALATSRVCFREGHDRAGVVVTATRPRSASATGGRASEAPAVDVRKGGEKEGPRAKRARTDDGADTAGDAEVGGANGDGDRNPEGFGAAGEGRPPPGRRGNEIGGPSKLGDPTARESGLGPGPGARARTRSTAGRKRATKGAASGKRKNAVRVEPPAHILPEEVMKDVALLMAIDRRTKDIACRSREVNEIIKAMCDSVSMLVLKERARSGQPHAISGYEGRCASGSAPTRVGASGEGGDGVCGVSGIGIAGESLKIGGDVVQMGASRACTSASAAGVTPGLSKRKRMRDPSRLTPEEKRAAKVARSIELHERYRGAREAIQTYLARANPGGKLSDAVNIQLEGELEAQSFFLRQKTCNRSLESMTGKKLRDLAQEVGSSIFDVINERAAQEGRDSRIQYTRAFNPEDASELVDRNLLGALSEQLVGRIERWREENRVTVTSFNLDRVATPKYGVSVGTADGSGGNAGGAPGGIGGAVGAREADAAAACIQRGVPRDARAILEMGEGMLEGLLSEDMLDGDEDGGGGGGYADGAYAGGMDGGGDGGGGDGEGDEDDDDGEYQ